MKGKSKGITLIALVITIIVLLILAGVSIAMLTGENGVLTKASDSKEKNEIGQEVEFIKLAKNTALTNKAGLDFNVSASELQAELRKLTGKDNVDVTGTTILSVVYNDSGRIYTIEGSVINQVQEIAKDPTPEEYFEATETSGGVFIGWTGMQANHDDIRTSNFNEIVIPSTYQGKPVIGIMKLGFASITDVESIVIPDTVEYIEEGAFYNCNYIKKVTLHKSVKEISVDAFKFCNRITNISYYGSEQDWDNMIIGDQYYTSFEKSFVEYK